MSEDISSEGYHRETVALRARNQERIRRETTDIGRRFNQVQAYASGKDLPFKLTEEQFNKLSLADCWFCGDKRTKQYNMIHLDRFSQGFTLANCKTVCYSCQKRIGVTSINELRDWFAKVQRNRDW